MTEMQQRATDGSGLRKGRKQQRKRMTWVSGMQASERTLARGVRIPPRESCLAVGGGSERRLKKEEAESRGRGTQTNCCRSERGTCTTPVGPRQ